MTPTLSGRSVGSTRIVAKARDLAVEDLDLPGAERRVQHVEMEVEEQDLEQGAAAELAPQGADGVAAVREQLALGVERRLIRSIQLPWGSSIRSGTVLRNRPRTSVPPSSSSRPLPTSPTSRSWLPVTREITRRWAGEHH